MKVYIAFVTVLHLCSINTRAAPIPSSDSWIDLLFRLLLPCETISFTQKTGYSYSTILDQEVKACNTVSSSAPSTVTLITSAANCSYKFTAFSGLGCQDDKVVVHLPLNSENSSVSINKRKTVCSFKLGNNPGHGRSVQVKFGGSDIPTLTHQLSQKECHTLCDDNFQSYHPHWVGVYDEANNVVVDNHVELFTKRSCADGSEIRFANGTTAMRFENLDALTLIHPSQVVESFFISEEVISN